MSICSTRRDFLKQLGTASVISIAAAPTRILAQAAQTAAAAPDQRVLVMIQLNGGNDGLNTLIPFADDAYYKARPGIGIPKNQVLRIDDQVGLHPRLTGLKKLYDEGKLSIVQGVGYPKPDRSHFRSMDIWHSAQQLESHRDGWLGRALEWQFERQPAQVEALTLGTDKLPLAFLPLSGDWKIFNWPTVRALPRIAA